MALTFRFDEYSYNPMQKLRLKRVEPEADVIPEPALPDDPVGALPEMRRVRQRRRVIAEEEDEPRAPRHVLPGFDHRRGQPDRLDPRFYRNDAALLEHMAHVLDDAAAVVMDDLPVEDNFEYPPAPPSPVPLPIPDVPAVVNAPVGAVPGPDNQAYQVGPAAEPVVVHPVQPMVVQPRERKVQNDADLELRLPTPSQMRSMPPELARWYEYYDRDFIQLNELYDEELKHPGAHPTWSQFAVATIKHRFGNAMREYNRRLDAGLFPAIPWAARHVNNGRLDGMDEKAHILEDVYGDEMDPRPMGPAMLARFHELTEDKFQGNDPELVHMWERDRKESKHPDQYPQLPLYQKRVLNMWLRDPYTGPYGADRIDGRVNPHPSQAVLRRADERGQDEYVRLKRQDERAAINRNTVEENRREDRAPVQREKKKVVYGPERRPLTPAERQMVYNPTLIKVRPRFKNIAKWK